MDIAIDDVALDSAMKRVAAAAGAGIDRETAHDMIAPEIGEEVGRVVER